MADSDTTVTCPSCNSKNQSSAKFCRNCGTKIATFDRAKWDALVAYDQEVSSFADQIRPLGQKWLDELAAAHMTLGNSAYLPEIVAKIKERAEAERKLKEEQEEALRRKREEEKKAAIEREQIEQEKAREAKAAEQKRIEDAKQNAVRVQQEVEEQRKRMIAFMSANKWAIGIAVFVTVCIVVVVIRYFGFGSSQQNSSSASSVPQPGTSQAASGIAPSFNCSAAYTWAAVQICQHKDLADLDNSMASLYRQRTGELADDSKNILRLNQRIWIKKREQCESAPDPTACLQKQFKDRIEILSISNKDGKTGPLLDVYPSSLVEGFPELLTAWRAILPPSLTAEDWANNMRGVESSIKILKIRGRNYYLGSVCKPHDCGANIAVFLISTNGRSAVASIVSEGGPKLLYGNPTIKEQAVLNQTP